MKNFLVVVTLCLVSSFPAIAAQSGGASAMPIYRCVVTDESGKSAESWVPQTVCALKGGKTIF